MKIEAKPYEILPKSQEFFDFAIAKINKIVEKYKDQLEGPLAKSGPALAAVIAGSEDKKANIDGATSMLEAVCHYDTYSPWRWLKKRNIEQSKKSLFTDIKLEDAEKNEYSPTATIGTCTKKVVLSEAATTTKIIKDNPTAKNLINVISFVLSHINAYMNGIEANAISVTAMEKTGQDPFEVCKTFKSVCLNAIDTARIETADKIFFKDLIEEIHTKAFMTLNSTASPIEMINSSRLLALGKKSDVGACASVSISVFNALNTTRTKDKSVHAGAGAAKT